MAHKRPLDESLAADGHSSSQNRHEFLITLDCYGTIKLSERALLAFPSSLLTTTLLGDGIDQYSLYVPIGRGHDSFPRLIQDIYNVGAPSQIPPLGSFFDLFVKWLRYLGLATSGRDLSTEGEGRGVSFFVETLLNTARSRFEIRYPYPQLGSYTLNCVFVPPPINRHLHNLVPFEFARRGVHMSVEKLSGRTLEEKDVNVSQLVPETSGAQCFALKQRAATTAAWAVTGVFPLGGFDATGKINFKHRGLEYTLTRIESGEDHVVHINQIDVRSLDFSTLESIVVLRKPGTDLEEEFKWGGMVYSSEKYGESLLRNDTLGGEKVYTPLLDSICTKMPKNSEGEDLTNAYLLVVASHTYPMLRYGVLNCDIGSLNSSVWRFNLEETPESALVN